MMREKNAAISEQIRLVHHSPFIHSADADTLKGVAPGEDEDDWF